MNPFNDEEMHRPVFERLDKSLEASKLAGGGFLFGGPANDEYQHLAQQYFDAAYLLTESAKRKEEGHFIHANPVLYLYRHSIELFLKAIMKDAAKTHRLDTLADEYIAFIKQEFGTDVPDWIVSRMKELAAIDPNSTAFRYNMNYDRSTKEDVPLEGPYFVDVAHLQAAMSALVTALVGVTAAVACGEGRSSA